MSKTKHSEEFDALARGEHGDPHRILGLHPVGEENASPRSWSFRAYHPDAVGVELIINGTAKPRAMEKLHSSGVFEIEVPAGEIRKNQDYRYRFTFSDGNVWERQDPYRFLPTLGDMDLHFVGEGRHWRLFEKMGAQFVEIDGVAGISFAVWAPNARRVSVIGDFNRWDGRLCPMRRLGSSGIWEIFIPGLGEGEFYKYEIKGRDGAITPKLDPYAFYCQKRPDTAGITWRRGKHTWRDREWMKNREKRNWLHEPLSVYEVHLGSWMRSPDNPDDFLSYRDMAPKLVEHCQRFHFNFVEFLPLAEHPLDASWGYQVTGYFAPTSRFGNPDDLKFMIDALHEAGIGVMIDWVPAHFPKDSHALGRFDGTALYEHEDPRQGEHRDWGTLIFNFGRKEVANFLITNALFWLEEYHIDAMRVDAVASMLYLDYSREAGEWVPNKHGGRENLEAIDFLRRLNHEVHGQFPGAFTVAEESTSFPGVSRPTYVGGLGFTLKWNMGWMNDSLEYFSKDPVHRSYHHNELTFSMIYAYSENFILPISHDEVVHGKGSLLARMPGSDWDRFANYRLLMAYMWMHPGKKLLFMGNEFAQGKEWKADRSLDWHEAGHENRVGIQRLMEHLGALYMGEESLWKFDHEPRGFTWIDSSDWRQSVMSFIRWGENAEHLIVACNFTPIPRLNYRLGVPWPCFYREVLNTDSHFYGGSNMGNNGGVWADHWAAHGHYHSIAVTLPPLSVVAFKPDKPDAS